MSNAPTSPGDNARKSNVDNSPTLRPAVGGRSVAPAQGGFTDGVALIVIGVVFIGGCLLLVFIASLVTGAASELANQPTALPNLTTTEQSQEIVPTQTREIVSTSDVSQARALSAAKQWNVIASDGFDTNANAWPTGTEDDFYSNINREVVRGKYVWQANAHQDFIVWVSPTLERSVKNFFATVECKITTSDPARFGLVFRRGGAGNYYFFAVDNSGKFALFLLYENTWESIIDWRTSSLIQIGNSNRITVLGEGSHFTFYINDKYVTDLVDDTIAIGSIHMAISMEANDHATYQFDNFEIRTP